ncbi:GNAT family N-acetyltransferase [Mycobacterium hackensackense]|jgi:ribosomal protein S18 acetylase RimI-like enzyme|uniref:GNAT family N-acetyltransferase n=1 Tax=Mycobacterium hackensackense TaxID=228909 RepID=UPI0022658479|nr:GNAT family N-acetyltransferase [Mycobacterium hackensackense]MCV7251635.1 GNAT family N-acetyltransferase [Mycobacterium hackensackense]
MKVRLHPSEREFGAVVDVVYRPDPVAYTVELTTLRVPAADGSRILLSVADGDAAIGAAVQVSNAALLTSGLAPAHATDVAAALADDHPRLPAVRGTRCSSTAFVTAWSALTGAAAELTDVEPLYRLVDLAAPSGVAGESRLAVGREVELLVDWLDAFFVEAFGLPSDRTARRAYLDEIAVADGDIVVWTAGSAPVSMARVHAPLAGVSRIGPVYTPPEHRGHGYAAAVTAAAARHAHRRGADEVVLFADAANPLANRVYQRIGFTAVDEHLQYAFTPCGGRDPAPSCTAT